MAQGNDYIEIDRADYFMLVPLGSTVDPEDDEIDLDHLTCVDFPNRNGMTILVIDDQKTGEAAFESVRSKFASKMQGSSELPSDTFSGLNPVRTAGVMGKLNGMKFIFEVAQVDGAGKSVIFNLRNPVDEKKESTRLARAALMTFTFKDVGAAGEPLAAETCGRCGKELPRQAKFCAACGAPRAA